MKPKVMILLGSASDFNIAKKAIDVLETVGISYDIRIASAHRTYEKVKKIVIESTDGFDVFLGIAGLSAHLPGMIAANTHKPVIGVPVDVKIGGLDALFALVQMPFGAPVATVGIDRGENGAYLASQIIGIHDRTIRRRVSSIREEFFDKVQKDEEELLGKLEGDYYRPVAFDLQIKKEDSSGKATGYGDFDVSVIAGSHSDMDVAKKTTIFLDKLKISYDFNVVSPVRHSKMFEDCLRKAENAKVFIAITGLSSHVAGAIVAHTEKPVIGVPCSIELGGIDALLSMVNMPPGVPVATVGIRNGGNAALLAAEMLGIGDQKIENDVLRYMKNPWR